MPFGNRLTLLSHLVQHVRLAASWVVDANVVLHGFSLSQERMYVQLARILSNKTLPVRAARSCWHRRHGDVLD
jgi:hypothetical protein